MGDENKVYMLSTIVRASTLVEALVAGTLFMIVFLITMSTATVIISVPDASGMLEIEQGINICLNRYLQEYGLYGRYEYRFAWGTILIDGKPYSEFIRSVHIAAEINGGQTIVYDVLLPSEESGDWYGRR